MTYSPELTDPMDRVRFAVGDTETDEDKELLPDVTYQAILAGVNQDETKATIAVARALAVKYAQKASKVTLDGGQTESEWKHRVETWTKLADRLQAQIDAALPVTAPSGLRSSRASRFDDDRCGEYSRRCS